MDVQPTTLQLLCDAVISAWSKVCEECFQLPVESVPQSIKACIKEKGGLPPYVRYMSECGCKYPRNSTPSHISELQRGFWIPFAVVKKKNWIRNIL